MSWCLLLWALRPGGGRLALALCCLCALVLPVLCVLFPVVLRVCVGAVLAVFLFPALPLMPCLCALSSGLVLRRLRPVIALGCCGWVGRLRLVVLFRLVLVCVVLVCLVWCFAPFWDAVWCCPPPPPGCCALWFFFPGVCPLCCPPPPPAGCGALSCALSCVLPCSAAVRGVFCVLPCAVWRARVGLGSCAVLLPSVAVAWSPVVACGCILSWGALMCCSVLPPVVRCAAVCVVSCWWCSVVSLALAGAVCCRLWLPGVCSLVRWAAVVFRWGALLRVLLGGSVACCPAVCRGLLWCPAALYCGLFSVVLCCRVVPCCGALLPVSLCWWCWFVSFPSCVRCCVALCCCWCLALWFVAVCYGVSLGVPWCARAALVRGVVCRGVLLCPAVFCGAVSPCGAVLVGCAVCSPLLRVFLYNLKKNFGF